MAVIAPNHCPTDELVVHQLQHVLGVVTSLQGPRPTAKNDYMYKICLRILPKRGLAEQWAICPLEALTNMTVLFFKRGIQGLPTIKRPGDVVYFQALKINSFSGHLQGLNNQDTRYMAIQGLSSPISPPVLADAKQFRLRVLPMSLYNPGINSLTLGEFEACGLKDDILFLQACWLSSQGTSMATPIPSAPFGGSHIPTMSTNSKPRSRRVFTINQLTPCSFFDTYVEPVRTGCVVSLLVTDYTENPALPSKPYKFQFPNDIIGRRVIRCSAWDEQATAVAQFQPGDLVFLRDIACVIDQSRICLKIANDTRFPDKIKALRTASTTKQVAELLERKEAYLKMIVDEYRSTPTQPAAPMAAPIADVGTEADAGAEPDAASVQLAPPPVASTTIRFPNVPTSSLKEVLEHSEVRAVGVAPQALEKFTSIVCRRCQSTHTPTPYALAECPTCGYALDESNFTYMFALKLQDDDGYTIKALVYGDDAVSDFCYSAMTAHHHQRFAPFK
ncbi:hypothetical protein H4R35_004624 [Dimargaris xerosporica]|nr:hypothetical protein H4R35_004624 [Dimargaris xerosporica]